MVDYHLAVLVHGIWGNSSQLDYAQRQLEEQVRDDKSDEVLIIHKTGSHAGYKTYDGIDVNGKRISDEILEVTKQLSNDGDKVTKFSIIGYSLGGLISRYAIGILYSQSYFKSIEPVNFVTFCTPHVGVLNPNDGFSVKLFNFFGPLFLVHTGSHLFLKKSTNLVDKEEKLPLLVWMSDPKSYFYKSLAGFRQRSLYANIMNDKRTSYFTSFISKLDPFNSYFNSDASIFKLTYINGYEPTVINASQQVLYHHKKSEKAPKGNDKVSFGMRMVHWSNVFVNLILFTPLWALWTIGISILERIKLNRRMTIFTRESSKDLAHLYRLTSDDGDSVSSEKRSQSFQSLSNSDMIDHLEREISNQVNEQTDNLVESVYDAIGNRVHSDQYSESSPVTKIPPVDPRVKLSESQFSIIENLNSLKWNKFPIVIRNTKATHAGSIVRYNDPSFGEGKVVISHFCNETFQYH